LQYFWVDTCCIDKSSHAEYSREVNAMFRYYRNASRCYVYLSDVPYPLSGADSEQTGWLWSSNFAEVDGLHAVGHFRSCLLQLQSSCSPANISTAGSIGDLVTNTP
jgi:hypothetical protein